jgi:predicted HicB family RNase H-like nuclease
MPAKKVSYGVKPSTAIEQPSLDRWVDNRTIEPIAPEPEKMKRMTNDIPESLHRTFKSKSSAEGKSMGDLIRTWIEDYCKYQGENTNV